MILLWIALATLISEDLTCIAAGLMVTRGELSFLSASLACFAGIFIGDLLLYLAGKHLGRRAVSIAPLKWMINEDDLRRGQRWFERRGIIAVPLSRFLPGFRLPTYVAAGLLDASFWKFALWLAIAGLVWTPLVVGLAFWAGTRALDLVGVYSKFALPVALLLAFALWVLMKLVIPLFTWRGRRLLLSRWRRISRWEFWPMWAFYPPIVLYVLWLAIKHRSLTLFTSANPAIFGGGFLGESKVEILRGLDGSPGFVARWQLVKDPRDIEAFMKREELTFPIVLKPDVGQRGLGVAIVRNAEEAGEYLHHRSGGVIAQEYVEGHEFGVFYYRYPNEPRGRIFSITEKRIVSVTGDGTSTLEELILNDARAVCMARFFLRKHTRDLDRVPQSGEIVKLTELGTHCRGALFLDGGWANTPQLETAIDCISRQFEGFHFGRYDIRVPSVAEFRDGRSFKIVELNGVTSEATHIYQPGNSLVYAYRTLMEQWRICFEIAAQNRRAGFNPLRTRQLLASVTDYVPSPEAR